MNLPTEFEMPIDRWAVRLEEPTPAPAETSEHDDTSMSLFSLEIPTLEFRPRLSRFDEAA